MIEVDLEGALEAVQKGGLILYPTETFYGIGADIQNHEALNSLFNLKDRASEKPVSILLPQLNHLDEVVSKVSHLARRIMDRFFPGPLTLVLPAAPDIPTPIHGGSGWVGIRQSSHPLARSLVEQLGRPITTTSANPSGQPPGQTVQQIKQYFSDRENVFFLSGGDLPDSKGSTVVKIDGMRLNVLRQGDIEISKIEELL